MNAVVTGTFAGMGEAIAHKFIDNGHTVHGIDILPCPQSLLNSVNYIHHRADVSDFNSLPNISNVEYLINNAGIQNSGKDIEINLNGVINCTNKYAIDNLDIRSVLNQADVAASLGTQFPEYVAAKGGVVSYTRWAAKELAKCGATCNSISFGGVFTSAFENIFKNKEAWEEVMNLTPLHKWVDLDEAAEWCYFLTVINKSASGQDFIVDNLESLNDKFIWR